MREVGIKGTKTPIVLAILAESNANRGDQDKAMTQIQRAEKLASEVLDGVQVHKKIADVLISKSVILNKYKKFEEALTCLEQAKDIYEQVFLGEHNECYGQYLSKKAQNLSEIKGREAEAEDVL